MDASQFEEECLLIAVALDDDEEMEISSSIYT
jgi:hypothetical protein